MDTPTWKDNLPAHRYFLHLSYCGAPFHGWQSQPGELTVQSAVEEALSTLLRRPMKITGAGRTDAGVNARRMTAHFDLDEALPDDVLLSLPRRLNALCRPDIVCRGIREVDPSLHARFSAVRRTYHYYALTAPSPFFNRLAWTPGRSLDYEAMNRAARLLLQTEDFTSFARLHSDAKTNICRVTRAEWTDVEGCPEAKVFVIEADRFLRNMVRAVVGTLVEVGRGKMDCEGFRRVIDARDRCAAATSMPAEGLYLWDIEYPVEVF